MKRFLSLLLVFCLTSVAAAFPTANVSTEINFTSLPPGQQAAVAVVVDIPQGLHAQSHTPSEPTYIAFKVTMDTDATVTWLPPIYPAGKDETYPNLGKLNVYTGKTIVYVPLTVAAGTAAGPHTLSGKLTYQMCDDNSCYPPQSPKISVDVTMLAPGAAAVANNSATFADYKATAAPTPSSAAVSSASIPTAAAPADQWSIGTALGAALLAGLLFNVMPCVLPVLPLKAVGFYEASQHNRARSFALGVVFSLGIIAVFAVLSLLVLVLKALKWGDLFTYGWFIWLVIVPLLLVMGFGLLGGWTLALPLGVYRFEARHDTYGGNFFWGVLTSILATPCTAPLLPPLLLWATLQPKVIGVISIVTVGVGMALPYLILSALPEVARRFPRSGPFTELFKQMMGFLLIASAAYFGAGRLIHGTEFWWVVTAVIAIAGVFMIARTVQLSKNARPVGIAATLAVIMIGGTLWWTAKITGFGQPATESNWQVYSDDQFASLQKSGKPMLVKFTANWCGSCQYIEGTVFRDARVWTALKQHDVTAFKADFSDDSDAPGRNLLLSLNPSGGIPVTAIYPGADRPPIVFSRVFSTEELLTAISQLSVSATSAAR